MPVTSKWVGGKRSSCYKFNIIQANKLLISSVRAVVALRGIVQELRKEVTLGMWRDLPLPAKASLCLSERNFGKGPPYVWGASGFWQGRTHFHLISSKQRRLSEGAARPTTLLPFKCRFCQLVVAWQQDKVSIHVSTGIHSRLVHNKIQTLELTGCSPSFKSGEEHLPEVLVWCKGIRL